MTLGKARREGLVGIGGRIARGLRPKIQEFIPTLGLFVLLAAFGSFIDIFTAGLMMSKFGVDSEMNSQARFLFLNYGFYAVFLGLPTEVGLVVVSASISCAISKKLGYVCVTIPLWLGAASNVLYMVVAR